MGATIKSLSRTVDENADAVTILLVQGVSMTPRAIEDLAISQHSVQHWFTVEAFLVNVEERERVFQLMGI